MTGGEGGFKVLPDKNSKYWHYHDALEYGCLGIAGDKPKDSGIVAAVAAYNRKLGMGGDHVVGY